MIFIVSSDNEQKESDIKLATDDVFKAIRCFENSNANSIHVWEDNKNINNYHSEDKTNEAIKVILKFIWGYVPIQNPNLIIND